MGTKTYPLFMTRSASVTRIRQLLFDYGSQKELNLRRAADEIYACLVLLQNQYKQSALARIEIQHYIVDLINSYNDINLRDSDFQNLQNEFLNLVAPQG